MNDRIESSIVRIRATNGAIVGAGFRVSEKHVLTCAHVVGAALGWKKLPDDAPTDEVHLDFPFLGWAKASAQVKGDTDFAWQPIQADGSGDIAVLELKSEPQPPADAFAARLLSGSNLSGRRFKVYGFPAGHDMGVYAYGELGESRADDSVQLEDTKGTGIGIKCGFSGTPVWDGEALCVVGMVVAADRESSTKVAFMIPTHLLAKACPDLTIVPPTFLDSPFPSKAEKPAPVTNSLPTFEVGVCTDGSPHDIFPFKKCTGEIIGGLETAKRLVEEIELDTKPSDEQRFFVRVTAIERLRSSIASMKSATGKEVEDRHKLRMALEDWNKHLTIFLSCVEFVLWNSAFRNPGKFYNMTDAAETICGLSQHCFSHPSHPVTWWMWYERKRETRLWFKVPEEVKTFMEGGYYENGYVDRIQGLRSDQAYKLPVFFPNTLSQYVLPKLLIFAAEEKAKGASPLTVDNYLDVSRWHWAITDPARFLSWE